MRSHDQYVQRENFPLSMVVVRFGGDFYDFESTLVDLQCNHVT